jgi:hypothetical protein
MTSSPAGGQLLSPALPLNGGITKEIHERPRVALLLIQYLSLVTKNSRDVPRHNLKSIRCIGQKLGHAKART